MGEVNENELYSKPQPCGMFLLVTWFCCCMWYEDKSEKSSGRHRSRADLANESGTRRRSSDIFGRFIGSSAVSLHIPSTSGHKKPLSAHRSHEEIGRRKSNHETTEDARYHSAPSVIDEVLHRRDWERSTKELHIPLKPLAKLETPISPVKAPHAEPESSSIEFKSEEQLHKPCKKHYTNIKSSKSKKDTEAGDNQKYKETISTDIKDSDDRTDFYIGDVKENNSVIRNAKDLEINTATTSNETDFQGECSKSVIASTKNGITTNFKLSKPAKPAYKAKEVKQSLNESIRTKERPRQTLAPLEENQARLFSFCLDEVIDQLETLDRSGATHHTMESRISGAMSVFPPPSVEAVGYEGASCYLSDGGSVPTVGGRGGGWRARHASDGDILAPPCRPESGAFSESDLDLELEGGEERPPAYEELHHYSPPERKETAI